MELIDFPYTTTKELVDYSDLVTETISSIRKIYVDPELSISWGEDRLVYWDKGPDNICFGRHLLFKTQSERVKFWTGLHATAKKANLVVCFEKARFEKEEVFIDYAHKLDNTFYPRGQYDQSPKKELKEVWISMEGKEFTTFCGKDTSYQERKDIMEDFLRSVLEVLNPK